MPAPIKNTQAAPAQAANAGATNSNSIPIASWSLQDPDASERAESSFKLEYENEADPDREEAVFKDHRKVVAPEHIRPGGKYRSKSLPQYSTILNECILILARWDI